MHTQHKRIRQTPHRKATRYSSRLFKDAIAILMVFGVLTLSLPFASPAYAEEDEFVFTHEITLTQEINVAVGSSGYPTTYEYQISSPDGGPLPGGHSSGVYTFTLEGNSNKDIAIPLPTDQSLLGKPFTYEIKQVQGNVPGVTYDPHVATFGLTFYRTSDGTIDEAICPLSGSTTWVIHYKTPEKPPITPLISHGSHLSQTSDALVGLIGAALGATVISSIFIAVSHLRKKRVSQGDDRS